jgi:hypothetical protein
MYRILIAKMLIILSFQNSEKEFNLMFPIIKKSQFLHHKIQCGEKRRDLMDRAKQGNYLFVINSLIKGINSLKHTYNIQ